MKKTFKIKDVEIEMNLVFKDKEYREYENLLTVKGAYVLSIAGSIFEEGKPHSDRYCIECGQCFDTILELSCNSNRYSKKEQELIKVIYDIWENYHLNDLMAGTKNQTDKLISSNCKDYKEYLMSLNLYDVNGYKYGSGWLLKIIPENVIQKIKKIIGER